MAERIVVEAGAGLHKIVARNLLVVVVDYMRGLVPETRNAVGSDILVRYHMKTQILLRPWLYGLFFYAYYQYNYTNDQNDYPRQIIGRRARGR